MSSLHYSDYLELDLLLNAQHPKSAEAGVDAHDEMLFIIIHQTYELWFKQIGYELDSVNEIMLKPALNDNSPELQTVVHRLQRITAIMKVLVQQIDVLETMTAMDFLDFRNLLKPASGFQSVQFKVIEARLGLRFSQRFGQQHYVSQLKPEEVEIIRAAESSASLLQLVNAWLERMPFVPPAGAGDGGFWSQYRRLYSESLDEKEAGNLSGFDSTLMADRNEQSQLTPAASRASLFIMLYRGYPILQLPFQLLNELLEIDAQLSTWRYRHMNMVHRMIGGRTGTGGSSGKGYLRGAADAHYVFRDVAGLNSFLVERTRLPAPDPELEKLLGFVHRSHDGSI